MAVPNITLHEPYILLSLSNTNLGITLQTSDFSFGIVEKLYSGANKFSVGDSVAFPINDAVQILYGSTVYYMINIASIFFKENYTP